MLIFTIGFLGANVMQISAIKGNSQANNISQSTNWGADRIERLLALDYDDPLLDDGDGDGTGEDGDANGTDDDGGNFGLDDVDANADGTFISPDGNYNISWNIAVDHPFQGIKTVQIVIVRRDFGLSKTFNMTYMKSDSI